LELTKQWEASQSEQNFGDTVKNPHFGAAWLPLACCVSALAQTPPPVAAPAAASVTSPTKNTLRIGVIGPFTGPSADFGMPMLNGLRLAADQINAVGGFLGRPIELVVKDDKAQPDEGLKQSEALVKENVAAVIGFCNTGVAMKALDVYQNNRLPLIVPCATGTAITAKFKGPESYVFRTSAKDAIQAPFVVDDLAKRRWTDVAIFADKSGYGEGGLKDVEKALAAKDMKAVYVARFDLGVKDLSAEVRAAKAAGADVIFSYTVGPENAVIANARKEFAPKLPQVGAWPLSFPFFIDGAKEAANGALMAQTFIAEPSNERRASFLTAYARKYNTSKIPVPMAAAQSYDTLYLLLYSLFNLRDGQLNGPAIKSALENISRVYYGVVTTYDKPFSLDDKDAITANMLVMGMVKNGAVTFAYPEDAKKNLTIQRKK
jgi:branched-chain amino acid transport system substrate-binding protein